MATSITFINYVCEQLKEIGVIRYRKMFGEFMVYVNDKPIVIVCNNTAFVKQLDCIKEFMTDAEKGYPYESAKEHYILDIDNFELTKKIITKLEEVTPLPKKKKN